jgi:hypothetical protein
VFLSSRILYAAGPTPVIYACIRHSLVEMLAGFPRMLFLLAPLLDVLFFWRMFPLGNGDWTVLAAAKANHGWKGNEIDQKTS